MSLPQEAETLKAEGNTLYTQGDHNDAIKKYTAAINIVSDNAILFANRAACRLALKQFVYVSAFPPPPPLVPVFNSVAAGTNAPVKTHKK